MRYDFKIENVVSTAKLSDHFDLIDIESKLEGAEYNKTKFPGLVYRIKEPKSVFLLFNSGKVVCTGCKSIGLQKCLDQCKRYINQFKLIIPPIKVPSIRVLLSSQIVFIQIWLHNKESVINAVDFLVKNNHPIPSAHDPYRHERLTGTCGRQYRAYA